MDRNEEAIDGDKIELEAEALADVFNSAAKDWSPELEWFGMSFDRDASEQHFVFEAGRYIDGDGLDALRERGYAVQYIEAYEYGNETLIQIELPVRDEVPE